MVRNKSRRSNAVIVATCVVGAAVVSSFVSAAEITPNIVNGGDIFQSSSQHDVIAPTLIQRGLKTNEGRLRLLKNKQDRDKANESSASAKDVLKNTSAGKDKGNRGAEDQEDNTVKGDGKKNGKVEVNANESSVSAKDVVKKKSTGKKKASSSIKDREKINDNDGDSKKKNVTLTSSSGNIDVSDEPDNGEMSDIITLSSGGKTKKKKQKRKKRTTGYAQYEPQGWSAYGDKSGKSESGCPCVYIDDPSAWGSSYSSAWDGAKADKARKLSWNGADSKADKNHIGGSGKADKNDMNPSWGKIEVCTCIPTYHPTDFPTFLPTSEPTFVPTGIPTPGINPVIEDDEADSKCICGKACSIDVLKNDTPDLKLVKVTGGANGDCAIGKLDSKKILYTANPGFVGEDSCEYIACDGQKPPRCGSATIDITDIQCPTVEPTLEPTAFPTLIPTAEPSGLPTLVPTAEPSGLPTLVPTAEPSGLPTLVPTTLPTLNPSKLPTLSPTFAPTVQPTEFGVPVVDNVADTINGRDGSVCIPVLEDATPAEGSSLSLKSVTGGESGECTIGQDQTEICYEVKDECFTGVDECQFQACDDQESPQCAYATVTINVINDNAITITSDAGTTCVPVLEDLPGLTVTAVTGGTNGKCSPSSDGEAVCYEPNDGSKGMDICDYEACDDENNCALATVTFKVVLVDLVTMNAQDGTLCTTVLVEGEDLTLTTVSGGGNGACSIGANEVDVCYTPNVNSAGIDVCSFVACDTGSNCPSEEPCASAELTVTVNAAPTSTPTSIPTSSPTSSPTAYACILQLGSEVQYWWNIPGLKIADLIAGTNNFQKPPDMITNNTQRLEIPPNRIDPATGQPVDNYGVRMIGYMDAPVTGEYTFWIASDDQGQFMLSKDGSRANMEKICEVTSWVTSTTEYDKYPEQKSKPISLVAGEVYYFEALMKEGPVEDYLSIAWQVPGKEREMVPGEFMHYCSDPNFDYGSFDYGLVSKPLG